MTVSRTLSLSLVVLAMLGITASMSAEVYQCVDAGGKRVLQERACSGNEVEEDTSWSRRRDEEKARNRIAHEKYAKVQKDRGESHRRRVERVRQCRGGICDAALLTSGVLLWLSKSDLRQSLGNPDNIQYIGGDEIWYYSLNPQGHSVSNARRLQITFAYRRHEVEDRDMPLVDKVNAY